MPRPVGKAHHGHGPGPGRGHGHGGKKADESRETTISKAMSFVLRHGAEKEGLKMDEAGYANVGDLLSWSRLAALNVTFPELHSIVQTNAKQRFALIPTSDQNSTYDPLNPAHHLIRANQGHSLPIASENILTPIQVTDPDCPEHVVHGTYDSKWKLILQSGGLRPMGRQHVHFAIGLPSEGRAKVPQPGPATSSSSVTPVREEQQQTGKGKGKGNVPEQIPGPAEESILVPTPTLSSLNQSSASGHEVTSSQPVISGMRATANVLIWVDLKGSLENGALKWWRSANGVVLTEGDAEGKVGLEWVDRVERKGGEVIWRPGEWKGRRKFVLEGARKEKRDVSSLRGDSQNK